MSGIERIIGEIEDYVEGCKTYPLSSSKIIVNKEELLELLTELRLQIPDEVKQYQKVIKNQDAIINSAKQQADNMVDEANKVTAQMLDEHEIMQKAHATANQIIEDANNQADAILSNALSDANNMKRSIMKYSDDMLGSLETIMDHIMDESKGRFDSFMRSMESSYQILENNRNELSAANSDEEEQ